jgi:hypothetical protein
MNPIPKVAVTKRSCPPNTWAWLETIIRSHAPDFIYLIEESSLHREFRQRAWNELCAHELENPS